MITIKTAREIELMREAGRIVALAHQEVSKHIQVGITTAELDAIVEKTIRDNDATPSFKNYHGYPASACISINEQVVHGIPGKYKLRKGDIVSVDIGANFKGYHGDSAWTYYVDSITQKEQKLLDVTKDALFAGLSMVKAGNRLSDVSHAIEQCAKEHGYGVVEELTGHGIGQNLHEDPPIPNFGQSGKGPILKEGMTLAIEPMFNMGTKRVLTKSDMWTIVTADKKKSAHFEHTIVVTKEGYEILTTISKGGKTIV